MTSLKTLGIHQTLTDSRRNSSASNRLCILSAENHTHALARSNHITNHFGFCNLLHLVLAKWRNNTYHQTGTNTRTRRNKMEALFLLLDMILIITIL